MFQNLKEKEGCSKVEDAKKDRQRAVRYGQYKVGESAVYYPDNTYIPLCDIKNAKKNTADIATKGCCGVTVTVPTVEFFVGEKKYRLELDRENQAERLAELLQKEADLKIQRVDILGLGALGVMYADFFTRKLGKQNVRILADNSRICRYKEEGVFFNGEQCDFSYCDIEKETEPADLLLVAVKYGALHEAIHEVRHLVDENTTIISVLNGIRSEGDLQEAFGKEKVVYCIAQKMDALKEGKNAFCKNFGELAIGIENGGRQGRLNRLRNFFDSCEFPFICPKDMKKAMWSKLLCNVGVNQTVSLFAGTYATVQQEGEAREMMKSAMQEVVLVANAEGIMLTNKDIQSWISIIDSLNPDGEPSMRQDSKAGRKTEVALFAGTICSLGEKHHIETPVNRVFLEKIQ